MTERDDILTALSDRLDAVAATRNPSLLLDPSAVAQADRLAKILENSRTDVDARHVLGLVHWFRYQALPEGQNQEALGTCVQFLSYCFTAGVADERLPRVLLPTIADQVFPAAVTYLEEGLDAPDPALLTITVNLMRRILGHTPASHPERADRLSVFEMALRNRFGRMGELADLDEVDLDEAIRVGRELVAIGPDDGIEHAMSVDALGAYLGERFEREGKLADLDEAIALGRDAVEKTPGDHFARVSSLSNLGAALHARFDWIGARADLDEAITLIRESLAAIPDGGSDRAVLLCNLGIFLRTRAHRVRSRADLDEAISVGREAVAATSADAIDRVVRLHNLGVALQYGINR